MRKILLLIAALLLPIQQANAAAWISAPNAANAVGTWAIANGGTGATSAAGARANLGAAASGANGDITSLTNLSGGIIGATGGGAACAGCIGEYIESVVPSSTPVSLTTATNTVITSITLSAGDWDVRGAITFSPNPSTNATALLGGITATASTFDNQETMYTLHFASGLVMGGVMGFPVPVDRYSFTATTTLYLLAASNFTVSTNSAYGYISARRMH